MNDRKCPAEYCQGRLEWIGTATYQCSRCNRIIDTNPNYGDRIVAVWIRRRIKNSTMHTQYLDKKTMKALKL